MTNLASLPDSPHLRDVMKAFPHTWKPLLDYHVRLLRDDNSPFSVAERELIAAYTSGLNQCTFCHTSHKTVAEAFGVEKGLVERMFADVESSGVDNRLLPVMLFVRKLTTEPSRVSDSDRQAILDAGWPDQAVHDAAAVCGLFNLMNRIVDGTGVVLREADLNRLKDQDVASRMYEGA